MGETVRSFDDVILFISQFDQELAFALACQEERISKSGRSPALMLEQYPFGAPIAARGVPQLAAASQHFDQAFLHGEGFPLGIVLSGYAEIAESKFGVRSSDGIPQAILKPGEFIGLFEFMDSRISRETPVPDWTIIAGSNCLSCPFNISARAFAKHVARKCRGGRVAEETLIRCESFLSQMKEIQELRQSFAEHSTEILYLGSEWFENFEHQEAQDLRRILSERAWKATSRIRPITSNISLFFFGEQASLPEMNQRQYNISFFIALYDLYTGRRPMFVPASENSDWGPYGDICTKVLSGYRGDAEAFVLRPDYLSDKQSGYMPLRRIAPYFTGSSGSHENFVFNALDAIQMAVLKEAESGGKSALSLFASIITGIKIRTPSDKKRGGSTVCHSIELDRGRLHFREIGDDEFFGQISYNIRERLADDFFRSCIKLNKVK